MKTAYFRLHPATRIRQDYEGYYLSSQLHRIRVRVDEPLVPLLPRLRGDVPLEGVLESVTGDARSHAASFLVALHQRLYVECFDGPVPATAPVLPENPAPRLQEVHLDLTAECNLRCRHCYQLPYLTENLRAPELSTADFLGVLDQLADLNVDRVNISGGEPLRRADLPEIIRGIYARGLKLSSIFTNGTTDIEPLVALLEGVPYPVDFSVSLDGPDAASHEEIRGHGTFEKTVRTIRRLADAVRCDAYGRYSFDVNTCMFRANVDRLDEMYDLVCAWGVPRWRLSIPRLEGAYARNVERVGADLNTVFAAYEKLLHRYLRDYDERGGERVPYLQIESLFRTSMLERGEVATFAPGSSCCEYKRYALAVKPNGDVLACTSFVSRPLGNVRERPLREIWYDEATQFLKRIPLETVTDCAGCELLTYCGTGCRSNVFDRTSTLTGKDELACRIYEFFEGHVHDLLRRRGVRYVANG